MCYRYYGGVSMKRKKWLSIFGVLVIIVCGVVAYVYLNSDMYTVNQVNSKMDSMIREKNYKQMKSVANNKNTYIFLRSLSSKDKVNDTSNFQGGSDKNAYYVTAVKSQKLAVYMRKTGVVSWEIRHVEKQ